jgi:hypothetical protein
MQHIERQRKSRGPWHPRQHADHPVLVIDLQQKPSRSFRTTPAAFADVHDNLSTANMDFTEFAGAVDSDGIFREIK